LNDTWVLGFGYGLWWVNVINQSKKLIRDKRSSYPSEFVELSLVKP
jgi:hypothetical protein